MINISQIGQTTGNLHIITIDGYTIGSDESNDLVMKDLSSFECWINYDEQSGNFVLHPTSTVGVISYGAEDYYFETCEELVIRHGMSVELGYNIIEMHLHPVGQLGQSETCDGCEPGLRKAALLRQDRLNQAPKETLRKMANKQLRPKSNREAIQANYRDRTGFENFFV